MFQTNVNLRNNSCAKSKIGEIVKPFDMRQIFSVIDPAFHRSQRKGSAFAGNLAFLAFIAGLVWFDLLQLPKWPTIVNLGVFALAVSLSQLAYVRLGFDSKSYRVLNYVESGVLLTGLVVQMGLDSVATPILWAFYLFMVILFAQDTGGSKAGFVEVVLPPLVLLALSYWGVVSTPTSAEVTGGLLIAATLYWYFGRAREAQVEMLGKVLTAEKELELAQAELKQQQQIDALQEDWLSTLTETATAIFIFSGDGELQASSVSPAMAGLGLERLALDSMLQASTTSDQPSEHRSQLRRYGLRVPETENVWLDIHVVALPALGATPRLAVLMQDATERVHLEAERRSLQESLAMTDKMASLGVLSAGVAHEINNPLTYILGNLEYLQAGPRSSEQIADSLEDIEKGFRQIRDIVRDLKTFSHPGEGESFETVDLRSICRRVTRMVQPELKAAGTLDLDLPPGPVMVNCRPGQIHQVLLNLLINARQSLDPAKQADNVISLSLKQTGDMARIDVQDTGSGIPEEHLRRIFDPFFTTKPAGTGTGIGLAVSYRIALEHGGQILVQSTEGEGSTFVLTLPLSIRRSDSRAPILIVDDEERTLTLMKNVFQEFDVTTASTLEDALPLMEQPLRAILCDVRLPDGLGFNLYHRAPEHLRPRFLFLTALPEQAPEMNYVPPGALVLHKPIPLEELRRYLTAITSQNDGDEPFAV